MHWNLALIVTIIGPWFGTCLKWSPPGPNDLRGPCPMMNTLANHGFIPHDGRNLTQDVVTKGLGDGLNFDPDLTVIMFQHALVANPLPNATFFDLGMLNVHNVLEHDASLSRLDAYFGNNHLFNQAVFDQTKQYWTSKTVDARMLTNSKIARQISSRAFNPTYRFTNTTEAFSLGELLAPIVAFGNISEVTVPRNLMVYFFENERLPTVLGWKRKDAITRLEDILELSAALAAAESLITVDTTGSIVTKRSTFHLF